MDLFKRVHDSVIEEATNVSRETVKQLAVKNEYAGYNGPSHPPQGLIDRNNNALANILLGLNFLAVKRFPLTKFTEQPSHSIAVFHNGKFASFERNGFSGGTKANPHILENADLYETVQYFMRDRTEQSDTSTVEAYGSFFVQPPGLPNKMYRVDLDGPNASIVDPETTESVPISLSHLVTMLPHTHKYVYGYDWAYPSDAKTSLFITHGGRQNEFISGQALNLFLKRLAEVIV